MTDVAFFAWGAEPGLQAIAQQLDGLARKMKTFTV
jgi:hypothetical protein